MNEVPLLEEPRPPAPVNRSAVLSLAAGILTVVAFCIGVAPIPFTGWVCYPSAAVLGMVALISGIASLVQISRTAEGGRPLATFGITVGALAILATAGAVALSIVLFPKFIAFIQEGVRLVAATWHNIAEFFISLVHKL